MALTAENRKYLEDLIVKLVEDELTPPTLQHLDYLFTVATTDRSNPDLIAQNILVYDLVTEFRLETAILKLLNEKRLSRVTCTSRGKVFSFYFPPGVYCYADGGI